MGPRGQCANDRKRAGKKPVPSRDLFQTLTMKRRVWRSGINRVPEMTKMPGAVFHMRLDLIAQKSRGQPSQLQLGAKVLPANTRQRRAFHRAKFTQPAQAFKGRATTDPKAPTDVVKTQWLRTRKKQSVNLRDRAWQ